MRHLRNVLTAMSLLLCLAAATVWMRSYGGGDSLWWGPSYGYEDGVACLHGTLYGYHNRQHPGLWVPDEYWARPPPVAAPRLRWRRVAADFNKAFRVNVSDERARFGFGSWRGRSHVMGYRCAFAPVWPVVAAAAIAPCAGSCRALRVRRRLTPGRCPTCGYDLRATPGRCPECGTARSTRPITRPTVT